jgi:hypothetical protein
VKKIPPQTTPNNVYDASQDLAAPDNVAELHRSKHLSLQINTSHANPLSLASSSQKHKSKHRLGAQTRG